MDDTTGPAGGAHELDELLGAYALDAVDDDDRRRVEDYLAVNPRAAAEVQAHREVATMLAFSGMEAPDDLWGRITDEIDDQAPPPGAALASVMSLDEHPRRRRRRLASVAPWVMTAAAVLALVFVAVGQDAESPDQPLADAVEIARADRDSLVTTLVAEGSELSAEAIIDQDGHGYVLARDLPTLSDEQTYQLWGVVESGDVISLGILGPNPEIETFTVDARVSALAITVEQSPGVISDGNPDGAFVGTF
jgi:anti-sigma-K factor RskA